MKKKNSQKKKAIIRRIRKTELFKEPHYKTNTYFKLGFDAHMKGHYEEAIEHYLHALESSDDAQIHIHLAHALHQIGESDAAVSECRRALTLDPTNGNAMNDLGAYLLEKKKYKEAEKVLIRATQAKNNENKEYTHFNLAKFYIQKGMLLRASKELRASQKINPSFSLAEKYLEQVQSKLH